MRVRCHERRAEMMDEMMSRTLLASFFSFSRPAPSSLFSSICLLDAFPRPPGVGERADCRFAVAGMETVCLLVSMSSLSRLLARSLFPAQSSSGLPIGVFLLPPYRMSDELVKTARADRSSVKPFQFIPIPFRPRIGCRMMCLLAACPLRFIAFRFACRRLAHPSRPSPRRACRASALCPPACLVSTPRSVMLTHRVCPSRLIRSSCLLSLRPLASLCLSSPSLVSEGGASCVSLSSRHAFRLPPLRACLSSCVPLVLASACLPLY